MKKDKIKTMIVTEEHPHYVIVPYHDYRFPVTTTIEELELELDCHGALLSYNEHVILAGENFKGETVAAIYEFTKKPKGEPKYACEDTIELTEIADQTFKDNGHAVAWALKTIK